MKLKEKIKRFWTLDVHNHEGFTLVELIIVIAILAILSSVAVVGYSSYVKKANMQADKTLMAEVANAVVLYNYTKNIIGGEGNSAVGYIIITENGPVEMTAGIDAALLAAYGANGSSALKLKYNGWTRASSMLKMVMDNTYAESVNGSNYFATIGTDSLLQDVQTVTNTFATFLGNLSNTEEELIDAIDSMLGTSDSVTGSDEDGNETTSGALESLLGGYDGEVTTDALANATVFALTTAVTDNADTVVANFASGYYILRNSTYGSAFGVAYDPLTYESTNCLSELAHTYAALEALVAYLSDSEIQSIFNTIQLSGNKAANVVNNVVTACDTIIKKSLASDTLQPRLAAYFGVANGSVAATSPARTDGEAYVATMKAVNSVADDYTDSLDSSTLFTTNEVAGTVDSFLAAALLKAYIGKAGHEQLSAIYNGTNKDSAVIIVFAADGNGNISPLMCA